VNRGAAVGGDFYSRALAEAWRRILERGISSADVDLEKEFDAVGEGVDVEGFTFDGSNVYYRGARVARVSRRLAVHLLRELLESVDRVALDAETAGYVEACVAGHVRAAVRGSFGTGKLAATVESVVLGQLLGALQQNEPAPQVRQVTATPPKRRRPARNLPDNVLPFPSPAR
jgi:hypothetical protein